MGWRWQKQAAWTCESAGVRDGTGVLREDSGNDRALAGLGTIEREDSTGGGLEYIGMFAVRLGMSPDEHLFMFTMDQL